MLRPVLRYPWLAAGFAAWLLVLMALPALSIHTKMPGLNDLPKSILERAAVFRVEQGGIHA